MKTGTLAREADAAGEARMDRGAALAHRRAQQSPSTRAFDRFMRVLELAGLALIAGHLAWAIYVSVNWKVPGQITAVWLALPASVTVLMILFGLHGAGIRAFLPVIVPGSSFPLVTGSKAVGMGLGFALLALVVGAFWGAFAWGIWTADWSILNPLVRVMGVVVGVGALIAVASDLYKRYLRAR